MCVKRQSIYKSRNYIWLIAHETVYAGYRLSTKVEITFGLLPLSMKTVVLTSTKVEITFGLLPLIFDIMAGKIYKSRNYIWLIAENEFADLVEHLQK